MGVLVPPVLVRSVVASPGEVAAAVKGEWTNSVRMKTIHAMGWELVGECIRV
jgi:hypothetical protein